METDLAEPIAEGHVQTRDSRNLQWTPELTAVHGLFQVTNSQNAPLPLPVSLIVHSRFNSARTFLIN